MMLSLAKLAGASRHAAPRVRGVRGKLASFSAAAAEAKTGLASIPARYPLAFGSTFTMVKTSSADVFAQTYIEGHSLGEVDLSRTATFALYGFLQMGVMQYFWAVKFMAGRLFPKAGEFAVAPLRAKLADKQGMKNLVAQVALDNFFFIPFCGYSTYYLIKEYMLSIKPAYAGADGHWVGRGLSKWRKNFTTDFATSASIWIPVGFVNFAFMPLQFRIPFVGVISFFYCVLLSVMRGGDAHKELRHEHRELMEKVGELLHQPKLDNAAVAAMIKVALKTAAEDPDCKNGEISFALFAELMEALGLHGGEDDALVKSLFDVFDTDKSGGISGSEMATLALTLSPANGASAPERLGNIFHCCDINGDNQVDFKELSLIIKGFLTINENLLINGGDLHPEHSMGAVTGVGHDPHGHFDPTNPASVAEAKALRLEELKIKYNLPGDSTLDEVLHHQAERYAHAVLAAADKGHKGKITQDEFVAWAMMDSREAQRVSSLFSVFNRLHADMGGVVHT